ncbi:alpha/beta fold hydrolase [Actinoplanes sp. M2I2]|uniref:alpha/beta fold hydrolase n=1 Tax=Actinoplanes sp. M2I2 TaxID=1734444 RepID=UPI002020F798|nr:alpha/beta hydrolase [Actinoplanes sp. M2I2]
MTAALIKMYDGVQLRTWTTGSPSRQTWPVVLVHGGPGLPDYLGPVAGMIDDLCLVHRYDQRGTGGSQWDGQHTIARHIRDLNSLLNAWQHDRVVLVGHSYGTNLAGYFTLAHPERVVGLVQLAGPFLGSWREADRATQRARRTDEQQTRLDILEAIASRTNAEETEYLTLSWFTDHADQTQAWDRASESAHNLRPVNYTMNTQLNAATKADPLESHLNELRDRLPPGTVIIGGAADSRPADALKQLAARLKCKVVLIPDAGHHPWLEAPDQFATTFRAAVANQTRKHLS